MTKPNDISHLTGYIKPSERPVCHQCGKPLKPVPSGNVRTVTHADGTVHSSYIQDKILGYGRYGHGYFCSTTCGYLYGLAKAKQRIGITT